MVTDNNSQVNSFVSGMDSDSSLDKIAEDKYLEARNVRITAYHDVGSQQNFKGALKAINGITEVGRLFQASVERILSAGSIRQYGYIIYISQKGEEDPEFCIARFTNKIGDSDDSSQKVSDIDDLCVIFKSKLIDWPEDKSKWPRKVSTVCRFESDELVKLYVATGFNPILQFNLTKIYSDEKGDYSKYNIDTQSCYPKIKFYKPCFDKYISGSLKPAQICYSYQLYNDFGQTTPMSPQCQMIPVINTDNSKTDLMNIRGIEFGDTSTCGIRITIEISDEAKLFDKIRLFRINMQKTGQTPTVEICYDAKLETTSPKDGQNLFVFEDTGAQTFGNLSLEEYNSINGIYIIPKIIESKDDILFASNVKQKQTFIDTDQFKNWDSRAFRCDKDGVFKFKRQFGDTIKFRYNELDEISSYTNQDYIEAYNEYNDVNKHIDNPCLFDNEDYYGGVGKNVSWRFVVALNPLDTSGAQPDGIGTGESVICRGNIYSSNDCWFIKKDGSYDTVNIQKISNEQGRIDNKFLLKSLKRNELYRYGIVLYDKYGVASPVKWIADIRTPDMWDRGFQTFLSHTNVKTYYNSAQYIDLSSFPLGVAFNIKHLPEGCTGYEIVRCKRSFNDIAGLSQGIISKPIVEYICEGTDKTKSNLYFPTGLMTTAHVAQGTDFGYMGSNYNPSKDNGNEYNGRTCATNFGNYETFQFVSPEILYQPSSMKSTFSTGNYYLEQLKYIFGSNSKQDTLSLKYYDSSKDLKKIPVDYGDKYLFGIANQNANFFLRNDGWRNYYYDGDGETYKHEMCYIKMPTALARDFFMKGEAYYRSGGSYVWDMWYPSIKNDDRIQYTSHHAPHIRYIDQYFFTNIKLYEQGEKLFNYSVDYKKPLSDTKPAKTTYIKDSKNKQKIHDFNLASELNWNEVIKHVYLEASKKEGSGTPGWKYVGEYSSHIDTIAGVQYCNVMYWGADTASIETGDSSWTIKGDFTGGGRDMEDKLPKMSGQYTDGGKGTWLLYFPFSTGGRAALINVEKPDSSTTNDDNHPIGSELGARSYLACRFNQDSNHFYDGEQFNSVYEETNRGIDLFGPDSNRFTKEMPAGSLLGTSLCNIRKNVIPYGGHSVKDIENSVYGSTGQYFTVEESGEWNCVFDGDVYITLMDYTSAHKAIVTYGGFTDDAKHRQIGDYKTSSQLIQYSVPVESSINYLFTSGYEFSKNFQNEYNTYIQIEPTNIDGLYQQDHPEYAYNTAYGAENNSVVKAAFDSSNVQDFNKCVDFRTYHSLMKEDNEHIDSWCKFQSSNYLDADSRYGQITNLKTFNNYLLFWQQLATGIFSVNERALSENPNGATLILGSGGVLSRYDYLDTSEGMHKDEYCTATSNTTLYWYDSHNNTIKAYAGSGIIQLSKLSSSQNILLKYNDDSHLPLLFYDSKNNEIVSNVLKDDVSIAFNEYIKTFTSLYTIPFDESVQFNNGVYLIKNNQGTLDIAQWDAYNEYSRTWGREILYCQLLYVVNKQPLVTKVFDNQEIVTPYDECELADISNPYFQMYHDYIWQTDYTRADSHLEDQITMREHNYRFAIPRETNSPLYGSRMRGKYLLCYIQNNKPNTSVSIQYILTKFRTSWS